jgi:hypothetical protein
MARALCELGRAVNGESSQDRTGQPKPTWRESRACHVATGAALGAPRDASLTAINARRVTYQAGRVVHVQLLRTAHRLGRDEGHSAASLHVLPCLPQFIRRLAESVN